MIKLVCNLTKNPKILPYLSKKGFLEILFDLLDHEKEKEIFGNVVTAISYLSVEPECQEKIIRHGIIARILGPLNVVHEVDQKLVSQISPPPFKMSYYLDNDSYHFNAVQWSETPARIHQEQWLGEVAAFHADEREIVPVAVLQMLLSSL